MGARRLVVGALGLLVASLAGAQQTQDFTIPKYDYQRTGFTKQKLTPPLALAWKFSGQEDKAVGALPVVVGNRLFFCSRGTVYALDTETGSLVWDPYETRYEIRMTPVYHQGKLFVGTERGELHILDAADSPQGQRLIKYIPDFRSPLRSDPVIIKDTLYLMTDKGELFGLDLKTLDEKSIKQPVMRFRSGPRGPLAYNDKDLLVFSNQDSQVVVHSLSRSKLMWAKSQGVLTAPPALLDQWALVGSREEVAALRVATGTMEWKSRATVFRSSPTVALGRVFCAGRDTAAQNDYLYVLDPAKGTMLGQMLLDATVSGSPVVADDTLWLATWAGNVYAIDPRTTDVKWAYRVSPQESVGPTPIKTAAISGQVVVANQNLFVVNDQGILFCFKPEALDIGKPQVVLPQFVTNAVDNTLVAFPVLDDEDKKKVAEFHKEDLAADPNFKLPAEAQELKLPCRQKMFRFQTYLYDEGSGLRLEDLNVKVDGKDLPSEMVYISRRDQLLIVDLVSSKEALGRRSLPDGVHTISLTVPDYKGNVTKKAFSVTINNALPPLARTAPVPTPPAGTNPGGGGGPGGLLPPT
jgi:outer membrane protein assembly factor BamB